MCPRLVEDDEGLKWLVEERRYPMPLKNEFVAGRGAEWYGMGEQMLRKEDLLPEYYDSAMRAAALRSDGLIGSVCFPTLPKFAGTMFLQTHDKTLADLCIKAYNDFVFEEWCAGDPSFYVPMIISQLWDPIAAAKEVRRNAERGSRAVSLPENTVQLGLPSYHTDHWDPLWQAIQETQQTVCMHVATSSALPRPSPEATFTVTIILVQNNAAECFINLAFSPVLRKFPEIQFVLSEGGIGWIPALLERADRMWEIHKAWDTLEMARTPSEIFADNFYCCWVGERTGVLMREAIGVDRITFETDYPHAETPFPHSQKMIEETMAGVPADEVAMMTYRNAARAFRWEVPEVAEGASA